MRALAILAPFILILLPVAALGQNVETGLVTCGYNGNPCDTTDVVNFVNGLITFLISLLAVIAVIMLTITGFQMVVSGGNSSQMGVLKSRLTNIIIGIVIILAAWLVVDTIMKMLTDKGLNVWGRLG